MSEQSIPQIIELADGTKCVHLDDFLHERAERNDALAKIERQAERLRELEGATNHAGGTPLTVAMQDRDQWRECAEKLADSLRPFLILCQQPTKIETTLIEFEKLKGESK